jgi:hypothetical protein
MSDRRQVVVGLFSRWTRIDGSSDDTSLECAPEFSAEPNGSPDALRAGEEPQNSMGSEIVEIKSVLRAMRGCSQSQLVEGEDGRFYVAKFAANPQGTRTLINEWITTGLFRHFSICTPEVRVLRLSEKLRDQAQLCFSVGTRKVPVTPGLHFGSACQVDPTKTAIFDFLPQKLLHQVANLSDFAKAFVVDRWLGNTDSRQAVFVRQRGKSGNFALRAYLLDHDRIFGGSRWELNSAPSHGLWSDRSIYKLLDMQALCEETLEKSDSLTEVDFYRIIRSIPQSWFGEGDDSALTDLLSRVYRRKTDLRCLIARQLDALRIDVKERMTSPLPTPALIGSNLLVPDLV